MTSRAEVRRRGGSPHATTVVPPGSEAPGFSLRDTPHSRVALADYRGRAVVLVFHVADWHPVAVEQLTRWQGLVRELDRLAVSVVGISTDATWCHDAFRRELRLGFPLLSDDDPPGDTACRYGILDPRTGRSRRALVVVDPAGVVRWSATFPDAVDPGVDGVLSALEQVGKTAA